MTDIHRTIKSRQQRQNLNFIKMRAVYTVVAVLWMAAVTGRAQDCPDRCSPQFLEVDPDPGDKQFRAEQTESCDYSNMVEILANTAINTAVEDGVCNGETYSMTDRNWMDQDPFEPNVASAFYLPPVLGCRWELWLLKRFDPIVGNNNCQCDDEDHVHFEDGDGNERKYCDFTDPPESMDVGWCANNFGPHNVHIQPAFVTDVTTSVLTTFRSDNCNGIGEGGMVFAYAIPSTNIGKRSVRQSQLLSARAPSKWLRAYCWKYNILCKYRKCNNYPCECYTNIRQRVTCTLYAIFTDATGRTAKQNLRSPVNVTRWAARHALSNIRRFGRPVPTYTQLQQNTTTTPNRPHTTYLSTHPTPRTTVYPRRPVTSRPITHPPRRPTVYTTKFPPRRPKPHTTVYPPRRPTTRPSRHPTVHTTRFPPRRTTTYPPRRSTTRPPRRPTVYPPRRPTTRRSWSPVRRTTVRPVLRYRTRG